MADTDSWSIDVFGIEELVKDFGYVERAFPTIAYNTLDKAGKKFKKEVKQLSDSRTKEHTGNLSKGYKSEVTQKYRSINRYEANVFGGARNACHYHLVENGHEGWIPDRHMERIKKGKIKRVGMFNTIGLLRIEDVKGKHMMRDTKQKWSDGVELQKFAWTAVCEALKKGGF